MASQIARSHHYWVVDGRLETFSAPFRYVWPSELDLMARLARHAAAGALERLAPRPLHQRQHQPRVGLGEASELDVEVEPPLVRVRAMRRTAHWWSASAGDTSSRVQARFLRKNDAARATAGSW